ncbi:hypothetical protein [Mesorhizobium cantuariense]|uniref:Uncharacterized protein n=1 Tax=Mesorhizobium cantuariense TaxID=1300275 RepID=A0ABV7MVP5_9HYPH
MTQATIDLEKRILTLFRLAYQQGRTDIAEHLLRALEELDKTTVLPSPFGKNALTEAYRELIRR